MYFSNLSFNLSLKVKLLIWIFSEMKNSLDGLLKDLTALKGICNDPIVTFLKQYIEDKQLGKPSKLRQ